MRKDSSQSALEGSCRRPHLSFGNWHWQPLDYRGIICTLFSQRWHNCFEARQIFCVYYLAGSVFLAASHAEMCLVLIDSHGQHFRSQVGTANPDKARQKQTGFCSSQPETQAFGKQRNVASRQFLTSGTDETPVSSPQHLFVSSPQPWER